MEFPTIEDLKRFPTDKKIKLQTIAYKNASALMGIKLKFNTNVIETPIFQKDKVAQQNYAGYELKETTIDTTRRINKIAIKV